MPLGLVKINLMFGIIAFIYLYDTLNTQKVLIIDSNRIDGLT